MMWSWLEKNHPVLYEAIQWSVLGLATATLIKSFIG